MAERPTLLERSTYRAWRPIATRWMDNDVYGHVNTVVYYSFFDTAVNAWLVENKLLDIEKGQLIGLVVDTASTYRKPVAFPQDVQAGIAVSHIGTSSVRYDVGLFVDGESLPAAQGYFVHVYVDRPTRRPQPIPEKWRRQLATILLEPVVG